MIILEICSRQVNRFCFSKSVCSYVFLTQGHLLLAISDTTRKVNNIRGDRTNTYLMREKMILATCSVFQQAVLRNVSDKNAQLQKQLDNVIREGERPQ